jgi:hypothetical protein
MKLPERPEAGTVSAKAVPAIAWTLHSRRIAMSSRYPPEREADLITAAQTFFDVASVAPVTYSLTAPQLVLLGTKLTDFTTKWDTCQVPGTRTKTAVELKNVSKTDLVSYLRSLVRITQNAPTTTNAMRTDLAIPLRDTIPTPKPVPGVAPELKVKKIWGHQITCQIESPVTEGRGWPPGVYGAQVYTLVAPEPTTDTTQWMPQGLVTRTNFVIGMPAEVAPGSKVWVTAQFVNPRGQSGVACTPVLAGVGYEGVEPVAV